MIHLILKKRSNCLDVEGLKKFQQLWFYKKLKLLCYKTYVKLDIFKGYFQFEYFKFLTLNFDYIYIYSNLSFQHFPKYIFFYLIFVFGKIILNKTVKIELEIVIFELYKIILKCYNIISIYIKAEDVAIYLSFDMYGNVFCMTRGSLVG